MLMYYLSLAKVNLESRLMNRIQLSSFIKKI